MQAGASGHAVTTKTSEPQSRPCRRGRQGKVCACAQSATVPPMQAGASINAADGPVPPNLDIVKVSEMFRSWTLYPRALNLHCSKHDHGRGQRGVVTSVVLGNIDTSVVSVSLVKTTTD